MSPNGVVNIERFSTLQEKNVIKILDIRSSVIKRKTFSIESMSLDETLERIAPTDCVMSASLCAMELSVSSE